MLIIGLITAREAILNDITAADVDRIDSLIEYLTSWMAAKVIENRSYPPDTYLNSRQLVTHALGTYLNWKVNGGPPDAPYLRLKY